MVVGGRICFVVCGLALATQKIIYPGLSCKLERDKSQTKPLTTLLLYLYKPASNGNGSITVDMQNKMYYISSISFVTSYNLGRQFDGSSTNIRSLKPTLIQLLDIMYLSIAVIHLAHDIGDQDS